MSDSREAMRAAVEALEEAHAALMECDRDGDYPLMDRIDAALSLLRAALEAREPVAVPAEANCRLCNGRGFYGSPGARCEVCKGAGKVKFWLAAFPAAAPVEAREAVAWRYRKKNWDNSFGQPTWGDWRLTEHKPQAPSSDVFQVEPLYASPAAATQGDARDAARYRWLRQQDWFDGPLCVLRDPKRALTSGAGLGADCPSRERLDAAIDAAIGAESEQATEDGRNA